MSKYYNTVIYILSCKDEKILDTYVGSTIDTVSRKSCHKCETNNGKKTKVYKFIRENGGWKNWEMVIFEKYPCETKDAKNKREQFWIDKLKSTLNVKPAYRTEDEKKEVLNKNSETIHCPCGFDYVYHHHRRHFKTDRHRMYSDPEFRKQREKENKEAKKLSEEKAILNKQRYYQENEEKWKEIRKIIVECECGVKTTRPNLASHRKNKIHEKQMNFKREIENNPNYLEENDKCLCECGYYVRYGDKGKWLDKHQTSKQHKRDMERGEPDEIYF